MGRGAGPARPPGRDTPWQYRRSGPGGQRPAPGGKGKAGQPARAARPCPGTGVAYFFTVSFLADSSAVDNLAANLGRVLGPGSLFALRGEAHHRQRRLLVPPFHGRRLIGYERIVEEETVREIASWPRGRGFPTLPAMMRTR